MKRFLSFLFSLVLLASVFSDVFAQSGGSRSGFPLPTTVYWDIAQQTPLSLNLSNGVFSVTLGSATFTGNYVPDVVFDLFDGSTRIGTAKLVGSGPLYQSLELTHIVGSQTRQAVYLRDGNTPRLRAVLLYDGNDTYTENYYAYTNGVLSDQVEVTHSGPFSLNRSHFLSAGGDFFVTEGTAIRNGNTLAAGLILTNGAVVRGITYNPGQVNLMNFDGAWRFVEVDSSLDVEVGTLRSLYRLATMPTQQNLSAGPLLVGVYDNDRAVIYWLSRLVSGTYDDVSDPLNPLITLDGPAIQGQLQLRKNNQISNGYWIEVFTPEIGRKSGRLTFNEQGQIQTFLLDFGTSEFSEVYYSHSPTLSFHRVTLDGRHFFDNYGVIQVDGYYLTSGNLFEYGVSDPPSFSGILMTNGRDYKTFTNVGGVRRVMIGSQTYELVIDQQRIASLVPVNP